MSLGRPYLPRIETDNSEPSTQEYRFSLDTTSPFTPVGGQVSDIPFRLSTSTNGGGTPNEPPKPMKPPSSDRARDERRKLLAHVLTQLRNRTMPPSVSDTIGTFHDEIDHTWNFKDVMKTQMGKLQQHGDSDSDDESQGYSTDFTFDLMVQLQEILVMSLEQRWDIFDDSGLSQKPLLSSDNANKPPSPFRRSRSSFYNTRGKSRSPSPNRKTEVFASELLTLCISILASVIAEDCRFQTNLPRPSRPLNALQVIVLNVAQVLLHINAGDSRIVSQVGLALVPAFSTFNKEMYPRLISFFDQGIIRNSLSSLRKLQGFGVNQSAIDDSVNHPLVSIHVDEVTEDKVQENDKPIWTPWTSTGRTLKIQSTNAPAQPISIYYLSSIVPPLLGCVLDNIELESPDDKDLQTAQFLQKLLQSIVDLKVDAYSDILQVAAYHTPKARKFAVTLLSSFWPLSVGHVVVSQPPSNRHSHQPTLLDNIPRRHQFTPWQFRHRYNWFSPGDSSQFDCTVCRKAMHGFGLLCPQCTCGIHFDCYDHPDGNALVQCTNVSDPHVQRVAMFRFSETHTDSRSPWGTKSPNLDRHEFRRINLFTLSLCCACHQPLWGCASQGLRCGSCSQFVHARCLDRKIPGPCDLIVIDSADLTIELSSLRLSCFEHYRDILGLSYQDLKNKSYEEISIFRDILSTQLQILEHGLALGALLVTYEGKNIDHKHEGIPEFELHHTIRHCEDLLATDSLCASPGMEEYLQENSLLRRDHSMLYTWSSLIYVVAAMKSPSTALGPSNTTSSDFLNVTHVGIHPDVEADEVSHPFDIVSLSHMRDVLGHEFHMYSDAAACVLLSHLHRLAFFSSTEEVVLDLPTMRENKDQPCSFPLPLGLDLSIDVETLVSAIEGCLSDIDLFVNEFGFLLLTRRMWPDGLMSDYGLKRLARGVFTWIINEDSQLAVILRSYLRKNRPLPGVASDLNQWPLVHHERHAHSGPMQNSGDYLASRQALLDRYAKRWLLALHNQDADLYARSLFNTCDELADHGVVTNMRGLGYHTATEGDRLGQCEQVLHHILRLSQARVLFSVSDTIYLQWLEVVYSCGILAKDVSSNTLLKLLTRDSDHRATTMIVSTTSEFTDRPAGLETDPWRVIVNIARASQSGLEKGLHWLGLLSRSGIEIPLNVYNQFIAILGTTDDALKSSCLFIKSTFASLWLRSLGRQQYQRPLAEFYLSLVPGIHEAFQEPSSWQNALVVIRYTLASCLLLYGCERTELVSIGLVEEELTSSLPSRRKLARETVVVEPVLVDAALMESMDLHLKAKNGDITSMIARFLHVLFTSPSFVEAHEMDNFILKYERLLSHWAWRFYDVQQPEIAQLRISVLLRVLSVDPEEFKALFEQRLAHSQKWESRASCASRLFRIIQDACSPAFNVDGRQWKSSIVNVFQYFFSLLWKDSKEEVRLVVKAHCSSLLPAHLEAITSCFDETITRAPVSDRIKLVSFLTQLRVHFPTWRVLSWDALLEVLAENPDYDHRLYSGINNLGTTAEGDPELAQLNVSLVVLALDMLSDGIDADGLTLIKIKAQLVRILGFQNVSVVPADANGHWFQLVYGELKSISEISYPCFGGLLSLLDSWNRIELPSPIITTNSHDDKGVEVLIGTLYADIPLHLLATYQKLLELPVLVIKGLLEAIHVIIYKHDFENRNLNVFSGHPFRRAIARILDLLETDVPYEVRQVALSVVQAFFKKSTTITSPLILKVMERVLKLVAAQTNHQAQDSLTEQGYGFAGDTFEKYCKSGLLINVLKLPLPKEVFLALKHVLDHPRSSSALRDDLLWDTISKLQETESNLLQNLLNNLQHFVELVHPKKHSSEMMGLIGKQLTHLAQRMSDSSGFAADASPLLSVAATLLQHNKANSKDLLLYIDTLIRVTLTRLQVDRKSISNLLIATASLRRKGQPHDPSSTINTVIPTVFEILGDGLRLKTRLLAFTLRSTLEAVTTAELSSAVTPVSLHSHLLVGLADGGCYWLDNHYWAEGQTEQDLHASLAVARMVFQAMSYGASMSETSSENSGKSTRPQLRTMRAWNILAMAALSSNADSSLAPQLFKQLKSFSAVYSDSLWPYVKSTGPVPDPPTASINHAYIAMKLWLMVARQSEEAREPGQSVYNSVWDELWPPFESIVGVLEAEAQTGVSPVMADFIASSIADLFSFVRFLRIPAGLEKLAQRTMLKRLQNLVQGESARIKLNRATEGLVETSLEAPLETLIDQAAKDIIATEKLRLLEAKREPSKVMGDRRNNIEKKTTIDKLNWKDVKLPYT